MTTITIEERLEAEDAESWSPNREDTVEHDKMVVGTLIDVQTFSGDFGDSPIAVIDRGKDVDPDDFKPAGRFVKWFVFGAVAAGEWEDNKPQIGERIGVVFKGHGEVKKGAHKGNAYPIYRLLVEREGVAPATLAQSSKVVTPDIPTDETIEAQVEAERPVARDHDDDVPWE